MITPRQPEITSASQPSSRYIIEHRIAEGGIGEVFQAFDTRLQRHVALKRLTDSSGARDALIYKYACREAILLASIQHPNVVAVYDFDSDDDGPFLILELIEGETLQIVVGRGAFPLAEFSWLAQQTLEGLAATHEAGLLHHDLQPGNLMLKYGPSMELQVKILDFGLADFSLYTDPTPESLVTGSIVGTVAYMSPEHFEHLPAGLRGELYSAGCIFYFTLTGTDPFRGETDAEVIASHLAGAPTPLATLRPDLPPGVCAWIMRLISRQPEDRPESVAEALAEFRELE